MRGYFCLFKPLRAAGNLFTLLRSITNLARLQTLQGRLRQAAATYAEALQVPPGPEGLRALVGGPAYYCGLGELLRQWNDFSALTSVTKAARCQ